LRRACSALLAGVALFVLWERLAYTGLLNFSSDYRAVGPFWEMHVGGAALDVAVVMLMPAAFAGLADERRGWRWVLAALVAMLGFYAALATFSRIVYVAVPLVALVWLLHRRRAGHAIALGASAAWIAGFALLAAWLFAGSGYRGVLALLGCVALVLPARGLLAGPSATGRLPGAALGVVLAMAAVALTLLLPKGAYLGYALAWFAGAAGLLLQSRRGLPRELGATLLLGGLVGSLVALAGVAIHWGGSPAAPAAAGASAALVLATVAAVRSDHALWPAAWRWQASVLAGMAAVAAVVGAFAGGAYMEDRMSQVEQNRIEREAHWQAALDLLHGSDWMLGKGLGRYWAEQMMSPRDEDQTGDYRWLPPGAGPGGPAVVLSSGRHILGSGEELMLSQRVARPGPGPATLRFEVLAEQGVRIDSAICSKFLLYASDCLARYQPVEGRPGTWQTIEMTLVGNRPTAGPWYAPRLTVFDISLGSNARKVELRGLTLHDSSGRELLRNGDFARGMAHWYFTSDRYHLPWHAKNLAVHLLFEQGLLGLAAFLLASLVALWRVTFGAAAGHPAAAMLAAGLVALGVVGAVDSVLDMPRVAFLAYLFVALALVLPAHGDRKQWRSPQSRATLGAGRRLG
ncbi:MAG: hypothetical protein KGL78_12715, partial [Burkholderiales bacterium]|nr:hypothetical protein [Burkholderiales bacterium]